MERSRKIIEKRVKKRCSEPDSKFFLENFNAQLFFIEDAQIFGYSSLNLR